MTAYHDTEWGAPLHDDRRLFEFLVLEGMQAGLSWATILHKRENFRQAFDGFNPQSIAHYGEDKIIVPFGQEVVFDERPLAEAVTGRPA